jgi:hypothetical protein
MNVSSSTNEKVRCNTIRIATMKSLQHNLKKWIKDRKQQKCDMTTHYNMIVKRISRTTVIPPNKPLWFCT